MPLDGHELTFKPLGTWRKGGGNTNRWQEKGCREKPPSPTSGECPHRSREALVPDPSHPVQEWPTQESSQLHRGFLQVGRHAAEGVRQVQALEAGYPTLEIGIDGDHPWELVSTREKEGSCQHRKAPPTSGPGGFPLLPPQPLLKTGVTLHIHSLNESTPSGARFFFILEVEKGNDVGRGGLLGSPRISVEHQSAPRVLRISS